MALGAPEEDPEDDPDPMECRVTTAQTALFAAPAKPAGTRSGAPAAEAAIGADGRTRPGARPVKTLLPMAFDGVGPSFTCKSIVEAMAAEGMDCELLVSRRRVAVDRRVRAVSAIPPLLSALPYRMVRTAAARRCDRLFRERLRAGDIAYLWPGASLETHAFARERGALVVLEGINTRMAAAREILDAAYAREGLAPAHGITAARIADEEAKLALTDVIFAPSLGVERSHERPDRTYRVLPAHYGTQLQVQDAPPRPRSGPLRVLFVGSVGIRKGAHTLLRAWREARIDGELILAGAVEPAVAALCHDELNLPTVKSLGFVRDVAPLYRDADVFVLPSLEEGDPLVTYEAAARGLPVVASFMGAGRMGTQTDFHLEVDPLEPEGLAEALRALASSPERRRDHAERALRAVGGYGWRDAGAVRADALCIYTQPAQ